MSGQAGGGAEEQEEEEEEEGKNRNDFLDRVQLLHHNADSDQLGSASSPILHKAAPVLALFLRLHSCSGAFCCIWPMTGLAVNRTLMVLVCMDVAIFRFVFFAGSARRAILVCLVWFFLPASGTCLQ